MQKWVFAAALGAALCVQAPAWAIGTPPAQRAVIRDMELLDRPDRVGHFYGNNVRRVHRFFHGWSGPGKRGAAIIDRGIESVDWRLTR